jgi:hypothetical protein
VYLLRGIHEDCSLILLILAIEQKKVTPYVLTLPITLIEFDYIYDAHTVCYIYSPLVSVNTHTVEYDMQEFEESCTKVCSGAPRFLPLSKDLQYLIIYQYRMSFEVDVVEGYFYKVP